MNTIVSWFSSVRGRITVVVTVVFALAMVLGGWFLLSRAEDAWVSDLEAADLAELDVLAQDLKAFEQIAGDEFFLPVGAGGTSFELLDEDGVLVAETPQGVFSGVVIAGGPISIDEMPPELLSGTSGVIEVGVIGDVTSVSLPVELSSGTLTLTASSSLEPVQAGVSALRGILLLTVPFLVGGIGAMTWFVTGRAFRPVMDITSQVERITDDRLDERVPVPDSRDEVAHLAKTMNSMLDRLAASRRRQCEFVSDASHELRSPVAASKARLEVALAHPDDTDWAQTAHVVLDEQDRLGGLVDDMLMLARLDEGKMPQPAEVDIDDLVFAEVSRPYEVEFDVSRVEAVRVRGDGQQLTRLVRNLVSNAARYAESDVHLSLKSIDGEAVLIVEDDGRGIPQQDRAKIFERFVRLEDSRTRNEGGAGLGLALVSAVAAAHGGSVGISDSSLGGAKFKVRLPESF